MDSSKNGKENEIDKEKEYVQNKYSTSPFHNYKIK